MNGKLGLIALGILAVLALAPSAGAISIGVSPGEMAFEKMLRGGYQEKVITISTAEDEPTACTVSASGPIADWVTLSPAENLIVSKGQPLWVTAVMQPPEDAANGVYTGSIAVHTAPGGSVSGTGAAVSAGAALSVSVEITGEQIKDAEVKSINAKDTEEGHPVEFSIAVLNKGNVIATPTINIDILDQAQENVLKSATHKETSILPSKMDIITAKVGLEGFDTGQYWGRVSVLLDQQELGGDTLTFDILERGSLSKKGVLEKVWNVPWAVAGNPVKIEAWFKNTGELNVLAKFKGEAKFSNTLVAVLESEELEAPVGQTTVLKTYFTPEEVGQYTVKGYILYDGKVTEEKESIVNVNAEEAEATGQQAGQTVPLFADWLLIIVIALLLCAAVYIKKR